MRIVLFVVFSVTVFSACFLGMKDKNPFKRYGLYEGTDLGLTYTPDSSTFRVWVPEAETVYMNFYDQSEGGESYVVEPMNPRENGLWELTMPGDLLAKFYTFQIFREGGWLPEVPDPYAKAVGVNGKRAMVIDLAQTNPEGWENDQRPPLDNFTDIIIYELHVRDLSTHPSSGIEHKGKFLGLTEMGTTNPAGQATGLDHIKSLGVTHVHLLPSFDYLSVDESRLDEPQFNWGYDPQNYNVPEGSYSTDPADGRVRIQEFKTLIQTLHDNGLRVIMDVVYNHTGATETSNFNCLAPGYYYRLNRDGTFSDASACGNEVASEREMVRKFMLESLKYWVEEYHIDGFRFDLMGIHDIETMNQISSTLHEIDPTIFIYGEGWTAGDSPLLEPYRALKKHTKQLEGIAAFSDDMRDGVKGHVFTHDARAFISGQEGLEESVKFGVVAATDHPQLDYEKVNYSNAAWANEPSQCINYASCHDNHTLWDRLLISAPDATEAQRIKMHKLANTIILTSQGVPFLHAGVELLRHKQKVENSYNSPDSINQINWNWKTEHEDVFEYYQGLIAMRKAHPAFRMPTTALVQEHLEFLGSPSTNTLAYHIKDNANGDSWKDIIVLFNGNLEAREFEIPGGDWQVIIKDGQIDQEGMGLHKGSKASVSGNSALLLIQE